MDEQHLRQILISVGVGAIVLNGLEFLLSNSLETFDADRNLKDSKPIEFLEYLFKLVNAMQHY